MAKKSSRAASKTPAKKAVLLTGGNPQIAKADGDTPVQAYIAAMPGWKEAVGRRLDALLVQQVPRLRKMVRWNTPLYGVEDQGWFLGFNVCTRYVKVTFFRGAELQPPPPVGSKTPHARYLHLHEHDELDEKQFLSWLRQASALPGWDGGSPKTHGGVAL